VHASVVGSDGRIDFHAPFFGPTGLTVTAGGLGSTESASWTDDRFEVLHDGLSDQVTAFASYVGAGLVESPLQPHADIVGVMAVIDRARAVISQTATVAV
jgi:hypothetical protein